MTSEAPRPDRTAVASSAGAPGPHRGTRLIAVAVAVTLLLTAVGAALAWRSYRAARARVIDQTADLSRAAGAEIDRLVRDRIELLQTVAAAPTVRSSDPAAIEVYLTFLAANQPSLDQVAWVDLYGFRRVGARAGPPGQYLNVADRDYFRAVTSTQQPFVGSAMMAPTDSRPVVPLAVPTRNVDNELSGILEASIPLDQLEHVLDEYKPDASSSVLVLDRADHVIADDDPATGIGAPTNTSLSGRARSAGSGVAVDVSDPRNRTHRLVAFAAVPTAGSALLISRSADEAFAPARRTALVEGAALVTIAVAGLAGAYWAGRRLDRLAMAQHRALAKSEALAQENERLYQEAKEAVQLRDDVLSGVSHDLKTPITVVKAQAQLLRRQLMRMATPETAFAVEGLTSIDTTTTRLTAMISEFLDLARLQVGQPLDLQPRPTDLVTLASDRAEVHQQATTHHRIEVQATVPELVGSWDAARLERVLDNLLSNAIKYSPSGGTITVIVAHEGGAAGGTVEGGWAVLSVRDEGMGIPVRDLPHVFERFRRAGNVVGRVQGTGIGLAGVKQIVEQHGGTITVSSEESKGTTVTVRLPLDQP